MRWLLLVCLVAALGCDVPQDDIDYVTCTDLCRCVGGLPSSQESCAADCEAQLAPVDPACSECVQRTTGSCTEMVEDCIGVCTPSPTTHQGAM